PDVISVNPSLGAWAPITAVRGVHLPVSSSTSSAFPRTLSRSAFPHWPVKTISLRIPFSGLQPFVYLQAPKFARLPDRSYRCDHSSQSSRGFYIRAEPASFPPQASDILTIRFRQLMVWGLTPHEIHSLVGCSSVMGIFRQLGAFCCSA